MSSHPLFSRARFLHRNAALMLSALLGLRSASAEDELATANQFLNQWLNAQNAGNFREYSALYHPNFRGVRRSGNQRVEMNRSQWLKDRGRMFLSAMTVSIFEVKAELVDAGISVNFKQRFKQGNYQDEGPKVMLLVGEGNAVQVISEEMLSSKLISSRGAATQSNTGTVQAPHSEPTHNSRGPISAKEAEKIVSAKLKYTPKRGSNLVYESDEVRGGRKYLVIHGYNLVIDSPNGEGHTATWGWYMVDAASGAAFKWDQIEDELLPIKPLGR